MLLSVKVTGSRFWKACALTKSTAHAGPPISGSASRQARRLELQKLDMVRLPARAAAATVATRSVAVSIGHGRYQAVTRPSCSSARQFYSVGVKMKFSGSAKTCSCWP